MADYKRMGAKARSSGEHRESCRFKKPDIKAAWQAGWDERDRALLEAQQRRDSADARLRWEDATSYSQGERGRVSPRCWNLRSSRLHGWAVTLAVRGATWCWEIKHNGHLCHYREFVGMELALVREMSIAELRVQIRDSIERSTGALHVLDEVPA